MKCFTTSCFKFEKVAKFGILQELIGVSTMQQFTTDYSDESLPSYFLSSRIT